jgi:peptide chain release factor 2
MEYDFKPNEVKVNSWDSKKRGAWGLRIPSGVEVIHLPTGIIVTCDKERSQHRNRHLAFIELEEKLKAI